MSPLKEKRWKASIKAGGPPPGINLQHLISRCPDIQPPKTASCSPNAPCSFLSFAHLSFLLEDLAAGTSSWGAPWIFPRQFSPPAVLKHSCKTKKKKKVKRNKYTRIPTVIVCEGSLGELFLSAFLIS